MKLRKRMRVMGRALHMELREHKSSFLVYVTLRLLVILMMILQIFNRNYENVFLCVLTLVLLLIPSLIQINLKIELPTALEITILVFIFAAEILGEIQSYYISSLLDTVLHTINGFLMAAIGFALVDILNRSKKFSIQLSPVFLAIVAFCFSMTIGVIWEFFEYGMDQFFGLDIQKDTVIQGFSSVLLDPTKSNIPVPVQDITEVLVNGRSGTWRISGYRTDRYDEMICLSISWEQFLFSIIGYFYVKSRGKGKFARRFIPRLKSRDADFLRKAEEEDGERPVNGSESGAQDS